MMKVNNYLVEQDDSQIREEIIEGLEAQPKTISSKYFYNEAGSLLFEQITELPEYYPSRTEKKILDELIQKLSMDLSGYSLIELGSGDPNKICLLLKNVPVNQRNNLKYFPVDISITAVTDSLKKLEEQFPEMYFEGIVADFMSRNFNLPQEDNRIVLFLGSTISNLLPEERKDFIRKLSKEMRSGEIFLLGVDRVKDVPIIEKAYNDNAGVTAEFNRNVLNNINSILQSDFNPELFEHVAYYNLRQKRIEMHLEAKENMFVQSPYLRESLRISEGERIQTENSYKFDLEDIRELETVSDLKNDGIYSDEKEWFSIIKFIKN